MIEQNKDFHIPTKRRVYFRHRYIDDDGPVFASNLVCTSRYTALNFIPFNLLEQFCYPVNLYFVFIAILQAIPSISTTFGMPVSLIPLFFMVLASGIRAAIEDYNRHKADEVKAAKPYSVYRDGGMVTVTSAQIRVGDCVLVEQDHVFPADIVILRSAHSRGHCFVETCSLDGETSFKVKHAVANTHENFNAKDGGDKFLMSQLSSAFIDCDENDDHFDSFKAILHSKMNDEFVLDSINLALRGTVLKNTTSVLGCVVFTGKDTKIRLHSQSASLFVCKRGMLLKKVDQLFAIMVVLQVFLCVFAASYSSMLVYSQTIWYLDFESGSVITEFLQRFGSWTILLSSMVPICFLLSIELVRTIQSWFMMQDSSFVSDSMGNDVQNGLVVRTSGLNDELALVQYVFTDKTGTLTTNSMSFQVGLVGDTLTQYGDSSTDISRRVRNRNNSTDVCTKSTNNALWSDLLQKVEQKIPKEISTSLDNPNNHPIRADLDDKRVQRFLTHLALSNTISVTHDKNGQTTFQSSSPDELAMCEFAEKMGIVLSSRNPTNLKNTLTNSTEIYSMLATLDFNSRRKRVTMVYQYGDRVKLMCKGADSTVIPLLRQNRPENLQNKIDLLSQNGLRTLLLTEATCSITSWDTQWAPIWKNACALPESGNEKGHRYGACTTLCRICEAMACIEDGQDNWTCVGVTALYDKLSPLVPECIADLRQGNIRVCMLTGDKRETALNIALACNLIDPAQRNEGRLIELLVDHTHYDMKHQIKHAHKIIQLSGNKPVAIAIDGDVVNYVFDTSRDKDMKMNFMSLLRQCESIIACRLTPQQKSDVVKGMREMTNSVCLAIGDGANDELMIKSANIGVGVKGVEGSTAAQAADYAINSFHHLHALLFVHGVWNFERTSMLILFMFYKTCFCPMCMFLFGFTSKFSGQPVFSDFFSMLYNSVFTCLPILVFGAFERVLKRKTLENTPLVYAKISSGNSFSVTTMFCWMFRAMLDATMSFGVILFSFHDTNTPMSQISFIFFFIVVTVVTLRCMLLMRSLTFMHFGSLFFSFLSFALFTLATCFFPAPSNLSMLVFEIISQPKHLLVYIMAVSLPLITAFFDEAARFLFSPSIINSLHWNDRRKKRPAFSSPSHVKSSVLLNMYDEDSEESLTRQQLQALNSKFPMSSRQSFSTMSGVSASFLAVDKVGIEQTNSVVSSLSQTHHDVE